MPSHQGFHDVMIFLPISAISLHRDEPCRISREPRGNFEVQESVSKKHCLQQSSEPFLRMLVEFGQLWHFTMHVLTPADIF